MLALGRGLEVRACDASRAEMIRKLNGQAHAVADDQRGQVFGGDVVAGRAVVEIPVDQIDNNPFQPRVNSMKKRLLRWRRVSRSMSSFSQSWCGELVFVIN